MNFICAIYVQKTDSTTTRSTNRIWRTVFATPLSTHWTSRFQTLSDNTTKNSMTFFYRVLVQFTFIPDRFVTNINTVHLCCVLHSVITNYCIQYICYILYFPLRTIFFIYLQSFFTYFILLYVSLYT